MIAIRCFAYARAFFLLAFVMNFVQPVSSQTANYDREADGHRLTLFMQEGGWCWFQDPRAIVRDGKLFLGAVQGNGTGPALVGVYDLDAKSPIGTVLMHENFDKDDHNSPVFYARPDGSVLSIYARHSRDKTHYYRIADAKDPLNWSEEFAFVHDYPKAGKVTYMNLFPLAKEGKFNNFYRGINFNPCFITSTDHGKTWQEPTHFIADELEGRHRPYARYAANGQDTVYVSFTDGHPDQFGNSIYYAAFRDGNFYYANGKLIKNLKSDGPLMPSEAEEVFVGGREWAPKGVASAVRSAWTSSLAIDQEGHPHIGYSLHLTNEDHRYRLASWDGEQWIDREIAHAGHCLYDTQTSYTGLITLDPQDPTYVVISTNVDPTTGLDRGSNHEIYRAKVAVEDDSSSIQWTAVTKDSPVSNLRPVIARSADYRVISWLRGDFRSYFDYQLDVVGTVEQLK